ncbi:MAG: ATP-binding protein [Aggregatilineales bacterium]
MSTQAQTAGQRLAALWQRLTEPSAAIVDPDGRRQARLLAKLALLLAPLALALTVFNYAITPAPRPGVAQIIVVMLLVISALVYSLARTRLYLAGAAVVAILSTLGLLITYALIGQISQYVLYYLLIPLAVLALAFSARWTLALLGAVVVAAVLITLALGIPVHTVIVDPLSFLLILTTLLLIARTFLDERERDRRAQLAASEERYRLLTELISDYAYCLTRSGSGWRLAWASSDFPALADHPPAEAEARGWPLPVHPDDRPVTDARLADLEAGRAVTCEFRVVDCSGQVRWIRDHARPVFDENSHVLQIVGAATDITARKRAERAEREQRLLAEALRDAAASVARTLDLDEVLDRILVSLSRVVPYDAASIMLIEDGVAVLARDCGFQYADRATFVAAHRFPVQSTPSLREVYNSGQAVLIADTAAYPGWINQPTTDWIRSWLCAPIRIGGSVIGFLNADSRRPGHFTPQHAERLQAFADQCSAAVHNARLYQTVREQAADLERRVATRTAELEQERRELATILDSMGEGMCCTAGSNIRYANRALLEMTGFTAADLLGTPLSALVADTNLASAADLEAALHGSRVWRSELLLRTQSGALLEAGITVAPLNAAGAAPGAAVIVRDISLEKALKRQKNRFISTAWHELRTPLTNLTTRLYLIQRDPARLNEHLAVIGEVVNRMRRLSEDLLNLARLEHGAILLERQPTVLQELATAVARVQQAEADLKGVTLALRLPDKPLLASVDPNRMIQVITNLLVNAINYTPAGGQVTLEVVPLGSAQAVIRVSDTGIGIAPEHLAQVFEPFFRAGGGSGKGTGLGLSIARELVQLHGGEISVVSEPGRGSTFTVRLAALGACPAG